MLYADIRTGVKAHWLAFERGDIEAEHAIHAADALLEYPQSGERFRGRDKIAAQRGGHPADRHFTVRRIFGPRRLDRGCDKELRSRGRGVWPSSVL